MGCCAVVICLFLALVDGWVGVILHCVCVAAIDMLSGLLGRCGDGMVGICLLLPSQQLRQTAGIGRCYTLPYYEVCDEIYWEVCTLPDNSLSTLHGMSLTIREGTYLRDRARTLWDISAAL